MLHLPVSAKLVASSSDSRCWSPSVGSDDVVLANGVGAWLALLVGSVVAVVYALYVLTVTAISNRLPRRI